MKRMKTVHVILSLFLFLNSCNFEKSINQNISTEQFIQLAKQQTIASFNYTIGLIELHKVRFGVYPRSLDSLKHLNYWDKPKIFEYEKVSNGYILNANPDSIFKMTGIKLDFHQIEIPPNFWTGLGLVDSNLKRKSAQVSE